VTEEEFRDFVDDAGYARPELWSPSGWDWKNETGAEHPVYWRPDDGRWQRRLFDRWVPLGADRPGIHLSSYRAAALCPGAGRRLPTEAEGEAAAALEPDAAGRGLAARKRRFPWGDAAPGPEQASLNAETGDVVPVGTMAAGESAFGCRHMIGNVWEWTSS